MRDGYDEICTRLTGFTSAQVLGFMPQIEQKTSNAALRAVLLEEGFYLVLFDKGSEGGIPRVSPSEKEGIPRQFHLAQ